MTNEQAVKLWISFPNDRHVRNLAFKAIWKNNQGAIQKGWYETYMKLKSHNIQSPAMHKDDYFGFLEDYTIKCIEEKYDPKMGKFFTYYVWIIRSSIDKYIDIAGLVSQPYQTYTYTKIEKGKQVEKKRRCILPSNTLLLDSKDQLTNEDFIVDLRAKEDSEDNDISIYIKNLLKALGHQEQKCISLYYGINNNPKLNLREISEIENVSKERIRQIIEKSKAKIKHFFSLNKLLGDGMTLEFRDLYLTKY